MGVSVCDKTNEYKLFGRVTVAMEERAEARASAYR